MILVVAEQRGGRLNRASWEVVAAAQQLARGEEVAVVLPGGGYAIQFPNVFPQALRGIPGAGTQDFRRANQIDLRDPQVQHAYLGR